MKTYNYDLNFIWFGGDLPAIRAEAINLWRQKYPDLTINLWFHSNYFDSPADKNLKKLQAYAETQKLTLLDAASIDNKKHISPFLSKYAQYWGTGPYLNFGLVSDIWRLVILNYLIKNNQFKQRVYIDSDIFPSTEALPEVFPNEKGILVNYYFRLPKNMIKTFQNLKEGVIGNDLIGVDKANKGMIVKLLAKLEKNCLDMREEEKIRLGKPYSEWIQKITTQTLSTTGPEFLTKFLQDKEAYDADSGKLDQAYSFNPDFFDTSIQGSSWYGKNGEIQEFKKKTYENSDNLITDVVAKISFERKYISKGKIFIKGYMQGVGKDFSHLFSDEECLKIFYQKLIFELFKIFSKDKQFLKNLEKIQEDTLKELITSYNKVKGENEHKDNVISSYKKQESENNINDPINKQTKRDDVSLQALLDMKTKASQQEPIKKIKNEGYFEEKLEKIIGKSQ